MDIKALIEANKESNRKVRQAIMKFNNYPEEIQEKWKDFTNGENAKSFRRGKDNYPCPVCGITMNFFTDPLDSKHPTIDHKQPKFLSRHLAFDTDNLWVICQACNHEKGGMTWIAYEYWLENRYGKNSRRYQAAVANRPTKI